MITYINMYIGATYLYLYIKTTVNVLISDKILEQISDKVHNPFEIYLYIYRVNMG